MAQVEGALIGLEIMRKVCQVWPLVAGLNVYERCTFDDGCAYFLVVIACTSNLVHLLSVSFVTFISIYVAFVISFMASDSDSTLFRAILILIYSRLDEGHVHFRTRTVLKHIETLINMSVGFILAIWCWRTQWQGDLIHMFNFFTFSGRTGIRRKFHWRRQELSRASLFTTRWRRLVLGAFLWAT